jgi:hypothetical protein
MYSDVEAKAQNIDAYCKTTYGSSSTAIMLDRNDAYSWRCTSGTQQLGVNVETLCHQQFGQTQHATMLNRGDAFSWRCVSGDIRHYSNIGSAAQTIGLQCARQSQGDLSLFVACANQQVVLPKPQQILIDCAARSGGTVVLLDSVFWIVRWRILSTQNNKSRSNASLRRTVSHMLLHRARPAASLPENSKNALLMASVGLTAVSVITMIW